MKINKPFLKYAVTLFAIYLLLDYGTYFFIGLTSSGGKHYISWLDKYFNYVAGLRSLILYGAKGVLHIIGYETYIPNSYVLKIAKTNHGVQMVYSCLGYGIISFWIAFIVATANVNIWFKIRWILGGVTIIIMSNILRVALLLLSVDNKWEKPINIEHHTFYNYIVYAIIITMMYLFLRSKRKLEAKIIK